MTVKQLVWVDYGTGPVAWAMGIQYLIELSNFRVVGRDADGATIVGVFDDIDAAKGGAQADLEARVAEIQVEPPSDVVGLLERLEKRAKEDEVYAENNRVVAGLLAPELDKFNERTGPLWNTYAVRTAIDHQNSMKRDSGYAADLRQAIAIIERSGEPFQARVLPWLLACFGEEISSDRVERGDRLLEEVFELLQSGGYDRDRVLSLRDYVWSRDVGEPPQETGGVMVTLAAYCLAHGLDMHVAGEAELARIWTKVEQIRTKQAAKPTGSALPVAVA